MPSSSFSLPPRFFPCGNWISKPCSFMPVHSNLFLMVVTTLWFQVVWSWLIYVLQSQVNEDHSQVCRQLHPRKLWIMAADTCLQFAVCSLLPPFFAFFFIYSGSYNAALIRNWLGEMKWSFSLKLKRENNDEYLAHYYFPRTAEKRNSFDRLSIRYHVRKVFSHSEN